MCLIPKDTMVKIMSNKKRVLFLCVGNSCRSQMAEGILRNLAADVFEAHSAGSEPAVVSRRAIAVMNEINIDISSHRSKSVDEFAGEKFDYVVTVCDDSVDARCPLFTGKAVQRMHVPFDDPAAAVGDEEAVLYTFRRVRDEIYEWVTAFAAHEAKCNVEA